MKTPPTTFETWIREQFPEYRDDTYLIDDVKNDNKVIGQKLLAACEFGAHSRDLEIAKLNARIEGLLVALQDKNNVQFSIFGGRRK